MIARIATTPAGSERRISLPASGRDHHRVPARSAPSRAIQGWRCEQGRVVHRVDRRQGGDTAAMISAIVKGIKAMAADTTSAGLKVLAQLAARHVDSRLVVG
jgi:hypothetical protein